MEIFTTALVAAALTALCVLAHFEALNRLIAHASDGGRRVLFTHMLCLLGVHIVEIWIYGVGIYAMTQWLSLGTIVGATASLFDHIYFSAAVYTTVGFGDLVPEGPLRLVVGMEALAGLALITWSASYTFLLMQRVWRHE